jgi:hypothetical protein
MMTTQRVVIIRGGQAGNRPEFQASESDLWPAPVYPRRSLRDN